MSALQPHEVHNGLLDALNYWRAWIPEATDNTLAVWADQLLDLHVAINAEQHRRQAELATKEAGRG
jgi:hypothetical protein